MVLTFLHNSLPFGFLLPLELFSSLPFGFLLPFDFLLPLELFFSLPFGFLHPLELGFLLPLVLGFLLPLVLGIIITSIALGFRNVFIEHISLFRPLEFGYGARGILLGLVLPLLGLELPLLGLVFLLSVALSALTTLSRIFIITRRRHTGINQE